MMAIFTLGFSVFLCLVRGSLAIDNFCNKNTFEHDDLNNMQFTKEVNYMEFAVIGNLKALHCCAKDYQTIEWYKDNKVYPWPLDVSTMLLFPASANQTIYVQSVKQTDAGNYTCVLRNDGILHTHTINLILYDKAPDDPKITYLSEDSRVFDGDKLRLYCEAFVGRVDLPDAHSEVYWYKMFENGTKYPKLPDYVELLQTEQEDGQTLGAYLMIDQMHAEDFGDYVCVITKPGKTIERIVRVEEKLSDVEYLNPNPLPVAKLAILLSAILCVILAGVVLYIKFGLKVQVRLKDSFSPLEDTDGKEKDVLLIYAPQDVEIALGVLIPTLEGRYNYTCGSKELTTNISTLYKNLPEGEKYRRMIILLSPKLVEDTWTSNSLLLTLKQLKSLGSNIICVSLKEFPKTETEVKNDNGETFSALIRSMGVILWERRDEDKFWYLLRLRLPPKRSISETNMKRTDPRLCNDSPQLSIEEYVV